MCKKNGGMDGKRGMGGNVGRGMSGWKDEDRGMKRWRYRWVGGLGTGL